MDVAANSILSPCNKVCVVDATGGLCIGCLRTLEEIAMWSRYSDEERSAVMADLPGRGASLPGPR